MTTSATPARPLRKDALRNRTLLLEAARVVFAERGLDASLDDIARQAGLGVGTAYRHFANKQEVVDALFDQAIDEVIATVEASFSIDDPWEAIATFFENLSYCQARDRGLHQMMMGSTRPHDPTAVRDRFAPPIERLLERAKAAGAIRPDIDINDLAVMIAMLGVAFEFNGASSPESWRRSLTLLLDGMRAVERGPLPVPPLSDEDTDQAMAVVKVRR